jgi:hypothetical protein
MSDEVQGPIGDTGATNDTPAILNPISVPNTDPGAMNVPIPAQLHSSLPLWAANTPTVWQQMGLAGPGCAGRLRTAHPDVAHLFSRIGEHAQAVLFHPCARLDRWPEMDVLKVMHNCYVNARDILNSKLIQDAVDRPRATAPGAQSISFRCYFMPFFGPYLRNAQIQLWAMRIMELMTMLITADENAFTYGFSQQFVNRVAVPLRTIYKDMLVTLLKVDLTKVTDEYIATDADFAAYAAAQNSVDSNLVNNQGSLDPLWTPSPKDRQWCVGAYTYLEAAPLLRVWPETAAPAIPTTVDTGGTAASVATGGINTTS